MPNRVVVYIPICRRLANNLMIIHIKVFQPISDDLSTSRSVSHSGMNNNMIPVVKVLKSVQGSGHWDSHRLAFVAGLHIANHAGEVYCDDWLSGHTCS